MWSTRAPSEGAHACRGFVQVLRVFEAELSEASQGRICREWFCNYLAPNMLGVRFRYYVTCLLIDTLNIQIDFVSVSGLWQILS